LFITLKNQQQELQMEYMDVRDLHYNRKNIVLLHGEKFQRCLLENKAIEVPNNKKGYRRISFFGKSLKSDNFQYTFQQLAQNAANFEWQVIKQQFRSLNGWNDSHSFCFNVAEV
jgi:Na+-transporting NADH:ubiquinone oxidoreductase subunit NqrF